MFNPQRFQIARMRRGLTKQELATGIGVSAKSIIEFEAGRLSPSEETIRKISSFLRFYPAFFVRSDQPVADPESASFRALSRMSAKQRDSVLAASVIAFDLVDYFDSIFNLPVANVPDLRGTAPSVAAQVVRQQWGLGYAKIPNLIHVLEKNGVRVFSLVTDFREVDAYSVWKQETPFIFMNTAKSAERSRFDAAHELGHLVLHRHGDCQGREAESQADSFASAFLMPADSVKIHAPHSASIDNMIAAKSHWDVSLAALAHRMHSIGLLSEWSYRSCCIEINKRGYNRTEPKPIRRESSKLLHILFTELSKDNVTAFHVARELGIQHEELDSIVFGLVPAAVTPALAHPVASPPEAPSPNPVRPRLRLVGKPT